MNTLLLVGAGQLGSRYLQGLVDSELSLTITVVEPSKSSLQTAISRWIEAGGQETAHQITWLESFPSDLKEADIALIVTSSKDRADIIQKITGSIKVRFWVLEKILTQSIRELKLIETLLKDSEGVWVNTPMRLMSWHKALKEIFYRKGPLKISYIGGLWGLASNCIHYTDLTAWWSGERLISTDIKGLDPIWFESKRKGYFEITGELTAQFSGGSQLLLCAKEGFSRSRLIVQSSDTIIWEIDEATGLAQSSDGRQLNGHFEFQSQLSGRLVDGILKFHKCDLPTLNESAPMHSVLLESILAHWNRSHNRNDDFVPIT